MKATVTDRRTGPPSNIILDLTFEQAAGKEGR